MRLVDQTPTEDAGKPFPVLVELVLRELLFVAVSRLIFIVTVSLGLTLHLVGSLVDVSWCRDPNQYRTLIHGN